MTVKAAGAEGVEQFVERFAAARDRLAETSPAWLMELRRKAIEQFAGKGFPTARDEAWRQTNVAPIRKTQYAHQPPAEASAEALGQVEGQMILGTDDSIRLVFVNGRLDQSLSSRLPSGGPLRVGTLDELLRADPDWARHYLCAQAKMDESPFAALNTALFEDGVYVRIASGAVIDKPIYIVHATLPGQQALARHPRALIVAGENAEATIFEHFAGPAGQVYFANHVTELYAGGNATVSHYKLQRESTAAYHIGTICYHEGADASVHSFSLAFGGAIARTDIVADLRGSGTDCTLNGLYLGQGTQHIDHHTRLEHAMPHCHSTEVYKGILDDKASAVFVGMIHVHPDAQKTDAVQSSKCVLLSDAAHVDSQPQLKIFADDVKCTHGAAIGQLDEDAIFYLRSRGIDHDSARGLLTYAFANDIIERIRIEPLRQALTDTVSQRFHATEYAELE